MSSWGQILPTVVDTILAALAPALPERIPAAHHALLGGAVVFFGNHPSTKRSFVLQSVEGGGWGGTAYKDGESASVTMCQGDVRNSSIEAMELKCPVLVESRALRTDSGGAGKHRGGLGLDVVVRNLVEGKWNLPRPKRTKSPPRGLWGGASGGGAAYFLRVPAENEYRNVDSVMHTVPPETKVMVRTGGGAGWGDPLERSPELVRNDVIEGLVSIELAKSTYGVVLDPKTHKVDQAATVAQRSSMKEKSEASV
jgi:N-methylhydantoinase B